MTWKLSRKCFWRAGKALFSISGGIFFFFIAVVSFSSKVLLWYIFWSRADLSLFYKTTPPAVKEEYRDSFLFTAFILHPYYFALHDNKLKELCSVSLYNFVLIDMCIVIYVITGVIEFFLFMFLLTTLSLSLSPPSCSSNQLCVCVSCSCLWFPRNDVRSFVHQSHFE